MNWPLDRSGKEVTPPYKTHREPLFPPLPEKPKCGSSDLFIWDAIELAGKSLLPDEWDGTEMSALHWPISPEAGDQAAKQVTKETIAGLWKSQGVAPPAKAPEKRFNEHVLARIRHICDLAKAKFEEAKAAEQALWEANAERLRRLELACDWLAANFRDALIKTRYRFTSIPGALTDEDAGEWNVEGLFRDRFVPGRYKRWFLYSVPPKQAEVFIFVDRASLDRAISVAIEPALTKPAEVSFEVEELSKYLRLALHVHAAGFGPTFAGEKKEVRKALVEAAPKFNLRLSPKQEDYLATFLRNEDAQLGKNKPPG